MAGVVFALLLLAGPSEDLESGLLAYESLDYGRATTVLERALASHRLGKEATRKALEVLARCYAVQGQEALAAEAFLGLLAVNPGATVSDLESLKIQSAFKRAQEAFKKDRPPPSWLLEPSSTSSLSSTQNDLKSDAEGSSWLLWTALAVGVLALGGGAYAITRPNEEPTWRIGLP